jgi:hypothetical protein
MNAKINIPFYSITDRRLHPTDHLVLCALCFFADRKTGIASCKRKTIAECIGIHETKVSISTDRLVKFGWLLKEGNTNSRSYFINWANNPEQLEADSATNEGGPLVADSATNGLGVLGGLVPDSATNGLGVLGGLVPDSATNGLGVLGGLGGLVPDSATNEGGPLVADSATNKPNRENQPATICSNNNLYIYKTILDQDLDHDHDLVVTISHASIIFKKYFPSFSDFKTMEVALVSQWAKKGVTVGGLLSACERTRGKAVNVPAVYVNRIIQNDLAAPSQPQLTKLPTSQDEIVKEGAKIGVNPKIGESWDGYRDRVYSALRRSTP